MIRSGPATLGALAALALMMPSAGQGPDPAAAQWPTFRGYRARGVAEGHALPVSWDVSGGAGVAWRTPVPGLAHSSPVVWDDRIYVTTAVSKGREADLKIGLYGAGEPVENPPEHAWKLYAIDATGGTVIWERTLHVGVPKVKRHPKSSHANSTPACDGRHVVAFFGSEGLYCLDASGELLWKKDFGVLDAGAFDVPDFQWGFASSPIIHGDKVIVQCDVQGDSFLAAFDLASGSAIWRTPREEVPTWGTPTVDVRPQRSQVICNGWKVIGGYDLETGAPLWDLAGGGDVPVPTPVVAHDLVYITNGHGRWPVYAIHAGVEGTISAEPAAGHMAWSYPRRGNYMQTPLPYGEHLYLCSDSGILTCYDARDGALRYRKRLGGGGSGFSASGVAGDGKLYFTSETGAVHVIRAGAEFEPLGVNDLAETCMSTPAAHRGRLFFRTRGHLVAIAAPRDGKGTP